MIDRQQAGTDRRQARILAMQALCQHDVLGADFLEDLEAFFLDELQTKTLDPTSLHARTLTREAVENRKQVDEQIQQVAEHWDLKRMASVDRNTLRVAVCEMLFHADIPPRVTINEAMEIGKAYGTSESAGFINGILDAIYKRRQAAKTTEPQISGATDGTV